MFEGGTSEEEMMRADVIAAEVQTNFITYSYSIMVFCCMGAPNISERTTFDVLCFVDQGMQFLTLSRSNKIIWFWELAPRLREGWRANARNVSFRISLRWPFCIIKSVFKTKLSGVLPYRHSFTVSLKV